MTYLMLSILALASGFALKNVRIETQGTMLADFGIRYKTDSPMVSYLLWALAAIFAFMSVFVTVPAGHVKVATLFGEVIEEPYKQGAHFPVNPLYNWTSFDVRQKTHKEEEATVPSQDKLVTLIDLSVQYRIIGDKAPSIYENTGSARTLIDVHLIPKLRSILREQGKTVEQAQDFFLESVQVTLQESLTTGLSNFLLEKGILVESVLLRDIKLPSVIVAAINATKQREQEVIRQKAELERFATEQEQKVKTATAERDAARLEAEKIKLLADAEAHKIKVINEQLDKSPQYVDLKSVEQWNGVLPLYTGGDNMPILDLRAAKK